MCGIVNPRAPGRGWRQAVARARGVRGDRGPRGDPSACDLLATGCVCQVGVDWMGGRRGELPWGCATGVQAWPCVCQEALRVVPSALVC